MPSAKSSRVHERKRMKNAPLRNRAKTFVRNARIELADNDLEAAQTSVDMAIVALDKASQKGAIHVKNAARRKSRIMKQLSQAKARQE